MPILQVSAATKGKTGGPSSADKKAINAPKLLDLRKDSLKISQINSCGTIDRIPWSTKSGEKRTRRIFRDELALMGQESYSTWELYQVLRKDGTVSFIFERDRKDKRKEYIAAKGEIVEHYIQSGKHRSTLLAKENMKPLINRSAITFSARDGSRAEFIPGQTEKSTVVLYPTNELGVTLAPVYLKGISCDKPESLSDDDIKSRDLGPEGKEAPSVEPSKKAGQ